MNSLGIILFWCVAQVTLLTLVAGVLYCAGRRLGPATGAFVALASLLLMTVITVFSISPWPNWMPAIETRFARATDSSLLSPGDLKQPAAMIAETSRPTAEVRLPAESESPSAAATQAFWQEIRNPGDAAVHASSSLSWTGLVAVGGWQQGGFSAALGDGSVRFISEMVDQNILRMLITRSDGQVIPGSGF